MNSGGNKVNSVKLLMGFWCLCFAPNISESSEGHRNGMCHHFWSVMVVSAYWSVAVLLQALWFMLFCSTLLSVGPSFLELKKRNSCFVAELVFVFTPSTSIV